MVPARGPSTERRCRVAQAESTPRHFMNSLRMLAPPSQEPINTADAIRLRQASWSRFWRSGALHSLESSVGADFAGDWASFWQRAFAACGPCDQVLDIGTGNGSLPRLLLNQLGESAPYCDAVDLAQVRPAWWEMAPATSRERVVFHAGTRAEALPFENARFQHVFSQFGLEYTDLAQSVPELLRVLAPAGRVRLVVHHRDSQLAQVAREEHRHAGALLRDDGLLAIATAMTEPLSRARTAEGRAELARDAPANALRARFNAAQDHLTQAMASTPHPDLLHDSRDRVARAVMLATQEGAASALQLLLDWQADLQDQALRLQELLQHALDEPDVQRLCDALAACGGQAQAAELHHKNLLMGWLVTLDR